jgi:hypothetical protein
MQHLAPRHVLALLITTAPALTQSVLYSTDFSSGEGWTLVTTHNSPGPFTPRWSIDALPYQPGGAWSLPPYTSAPSSLNFNSNDFGLPNTGVWSGHATSPTIDLSAADGDITLQFQYGFIHEINCQWDAFEVEVLSAASGAVLHSTCLSATWYASGVWRSFELPLERAWGEIHVRFLHDSIDHWNLNEQGSFVDDLRVVAECGASLHCTGAPQSTGAPGAAISALGSTSISARDLRLVGAGFPTHTFAWAFAGPDVATIPIGIGVRCIGVGTSRRLALAPTRDQGAPQWALDLGAAPLAQLAVAGSPLYVQTIYRDGPNINLSDALRLAICP